MTEDRIPLHPLDRIPPPPERLTLATADEVTFAIKLGLTLGSDGRLGRRRSAEDPQRREVEDAATAGRIYDRLRGMNFWIFSGPPRAPHGGSQPGPPRPGEVGE